MSVPIPRPCHASATAKASSARSPLDSGTKQAWATTWPSTPAVATRPTPWSTSPRAARRGEMPPPRKRNQRASADSPSRNVATASTSAGTVGRTWTVEPSRRTTSAAPLRVAYTVSSPASRGVSEMVEVMSSGLRTTGARSVLGA